MLKKINLIILVIIITAAAILIGLGPRLTIAQTQNLIVTADPLPVVGSGSAANKGYTKVTIKQDPGSNVSVPASAEFVQFKIDGSPLGTPLSKYDKTPPWPIGSYISAELIKENHEYLLEAVFLNANKNPIGVTLTNHITVKRDDTLVANPDTGQNQSATDWAASGKPYLEFPSTIEAGNEFDATLKNVPQQAGTYNLIAATDAIGTNASMIGFFDVLANMSFDHLTITVEPTQFIWGWGSYYLWIEDSNRFQISQPQELMVTRSTYPEIKAPGCTIAGQEFIITADKLVPGIDKEIFAYATEKDKAGAIEHQIADKPVEAGVFSTMILAKIPAVGVYNIRVSSKNPQWSTENAPITAYLSSPGNLSACKTNALSTLPLVGVTQIGTPGSPTPIGTPGGPGGAIGTPGGPEGELPTAGFTGGSNTAAEAGNVGISPTSSNNFRLYLQETYTWLSIVISILAIVMIMWGGYLYMTSGGNAEITKKAKDVIIGALSGIIIVALTWLFFNTINPQIFQELPSLSNLSATGANSLQGGAAGAANTAAPPANTPVYGPPNNPNNTID